jgi:hypothetical protein
MEVLTSKAVQKKALGLTAALAVAVLGASCGSSQSAISDSTFPTAAAWIEHHFPPGSVEGPVASGVVSGPHHTQQEVWRVPYAVTITVAGRPVKLASGTSIYITVQVAEPTFIGPVYYGHQSRPARTWHVLTRHPHA